MSSEAAKKPISDEKFEQFKTELENLTLTGYQLGELFVILNQKLKEIS